MLQSRVRRSCSPPLEGESFRSPPSVRLLTGHSCSRTARGDLSLSLSLSMYLYLYLSLETLVPSICHFSFHFSILESLPAGLGQARTCLARPPAPAKVHNTLSRICRLPLDLSLIVYRLLGLFFTDGGRAK